MTLGNLVSMGHQHSPASVTKFKNPKVSIIIPTRDKPQLLEACVRSIQTHTSYSNFEIIIINNNSIQEETKSALDRYQKDGIVVLDYPKKFNFSAICNLAASKATGEFLCYLNNDVQIIESGWLKAMLDHARQPEVGIVGALLTFPTGEIQHMGIAIKLQGIASHPFRGEATSGRLPTDCFQVSAVTFALAMISSEKFESLGGLDENFPVGYNDVDIGIRSLEKGWKNVVCVSAHTNHTESQTRSKSRSIRGLILASQDIIKFLRKHPKLVRENFFTR
jgi:GT2 family glycosyltransferase